MINLALTSFQTILNQALQLDPLTTQRLQQLDENVVLFIVEPLALNIYFSIAGQYIQVLDECAKPPACTIRASATTFVKLLMRHNQPVNDLIQRGEMTVIGDMTIAQQIQQLFSELNIDWEQQLAKLTGEVAAFHVSNLWRHGREFSKQFYTALATSISDHLQEETRVLPTRDEIECFFADVDDLQLEVDRLGAKIHNLILLNNYD